MSQSGENNDNQEHLPTKGRIAVGHPVDVASGNLFHEFTDYTLDGKFPLSFRRRYSTALLNRNSHGFLGPGWSSPFEAKLIQDENDFRYLDESGENEIVFLLPETPVDSAHPLLNAGAYAELVLIDNEYCITRWDPDSGSVTKDFFPVGMTGDHTSIKRREDAAGSSIEFIYSEKSGLLKYVVQKREQRGFQFLYDQSGRLITVQRKSRHVADSDTNTDTKPWLQFSYDQSGMLQSFTDPLGNQSHYKYDAQGRMTNERTIGGKEWRFLFDDKGRCIVTTAKNRFDYCRLYYSKGNERITRVEDSHGQITTYHFNRHGQVENIVSPLGNEKKTVFDSVGRTVQETDDAGALVQYTYDAYGNRNSITRADGSRLLFEYNQQHLPVTFIDALGNQWTRQYDDNGLVLQTSDPIGATDEYKYSKSADLIEHIDAHKNRRSFEWDQFGNLTAASDWEHNRTCFNHDNFGNLISIKDAKNQSYTIERDKLDRIKTVTHPDGTQRHYTWNVFNQLSESVDELGHPRTYQYCDCGNIELEQLPDGSTIHYGWDSIPGQLIALTNQNAEVFHFEYDADGRVIAETDFSGAVTRYEYYANGQISRVIKPSGKTVKYSYDAVGRTTRITYDDETQTSYAYDLNGNLTSADNGDRPVTFTYDAAGRLVHETQGQNELWHELDELNRRTKRKASDGTTTDFFWSANGNIEKIQTTGFDAINFLYDSNGNEVERQLGKHLQISTQLDSSGRVSSQRFNVSKSSNSIERRYDYDARGSLTKKTDSNWGTTHYAYDELDRVTKTIHPDSEVESHTYDRANNVIAYVRGKNKDKENTSSEHLGTDTWVYSSGSRIQQRGDTRYHYDDDGQLVKRTNPNGVTKYVWNSAGQLSGLTNPAGETWTYVYDPLGRRVQKTDSNTSHCFFWDGDVVFQETITNAETERCDTWEFHPYDFSPLGKLQEGKQYFSLNDQVGAPLELVDWQGDIVWSLRTYLHGAHKASEERGIDCSVRFQGQWFDAESNLSYNRNRYYSPEIAAFISDDPIGLAGGVNPRTAGHNTVGYIDPYGLTSFCSKLPTRFRFICSGFNRIREWIKGNKSTPDVPNSASNELATYYPTNRGFLGQSEKIVLQPGTKIDRYGYDGGTFVSPEGTPAQMRALPPGTTDKPYSVFEVAKPITVDAGTVAPAFGQIGLGTQYELPSSVGELLQSGALKRVDQ